MIVRWLRNPHSLSWAHIAPYAFSYALLPIVLFALFWLKPIIGVPVALLVGIAWAVASNLSILNRIPLLRRWTHAERIMQNPLALESDDSEKALSLKGYTFVILFLVALLWCYFGGIGGSWSQSSDWSARNAVFYDLIAKPWPLYYNDGAYTLVYYINHWLPVAAPMHMLFAITGDLGLCIGIGNVLLLLWTAAGVFIVELLIARIFGISKKKHLVLMVLVFVLFSGMDIVGLIARALNGYPDPSAIAFSHMHLEWWAGLGAYQFSSNTTLLYWVFNQTIIPWICVCITLLSRNLSTYILVFAACFAAGPYASIGLAAIMCALGISSLFKMRRAGHVNTWVKSIRSPVNIIAIVPVVIYALFFTCNQSVATTDQRMELFGIVPDTSLWLLFLFLLLEGGVYLIIVHRDYCKNPLFRAVCITLAAVPLIHFGSMYEFCCRASIPALFILMLMCLGYLIRRMDSLVEKPVKMNAVSWLLVIALVVGALTPGFEFMRGVVDVRQNGVASAVEQPIDIEDSIVAPGMASNFKSEVKEEHPFFKYLIGK